MYFFINNPLMRIAEFLFAGLVLMVAFRVFNKFAGSIIEEKKRLLFVQWRRIQIVFWLVYSLFLYSMLFRYDMLMTLIVTVVVLGLGWNYWKDIFAGILIKLRNQFAVGDFISTGFSKGVLQKIDFSQSSLVNDAGELVIIPNSLLRNEVMTHHHQTVSDASVYSVEVKSARSQTIADIYEFAYNCPYISANKEINIEKQSDGVFSIRASIIDSSFSDQADIYFEGLSRVGSEPEQ